MFLALARRAAIPAVTSATTRRFISVQVQGTRDDGALPGAEHSLTQSILHGSPEAKEAGDLEVQQHSKLVARGKYLHGFESEWTKS